MTSINKFCKYLLTLYFALERTDLQYEACVGLRVEDKMWSACTNAVLYFIELRIYSVYSQGSDEPDSVAFGNVEKTKVFD